MPVMKDFSPTRSLRPIYPFVSSFPVSAYVFYEGVRGMRLSIRLVNSRHSIFQYQEIHLERCVEATLCIAFIFLSLLNVLLLKDKMKRLKNILLSEKNNLHEY